MHQLPETGYLRLKQILGDPKANPPIPAIIPISKSSWWEGCKTGRYPKPVKLGPSYNRLARVRHPRFDCGIGGWHGQQ